MPIVVTHTLGRDDGGYINLGTLGPLGSQMLSEAGKAYAFWIRTVDANNIIPLCFNWFSYDPIGPAFSLFMLNGTWTTDYAPLANSVVTFCPTDNLSWAFHKDTGVNFNDEQYHHHVLTWTGLTSNKPTVLDYYIDGIRTTTAWTDFSDGAVSGLTDYQQDVYMGCSQKTVANTLTDFASFRIADFRIYDRGLDANEIYQIYRLRGRDNVRRGLHSRYNFQTTPNNTGYHGVPAILSQDNGIVPTFNNDSVLSGVRKKVM